MVPIAASVPAVRTTRGVWRGPGLTMLALLGVPAALQELPTRCVSSLKGANPSVLFLPVHGPVLVLLQPGWVEPPAASSLHLRPPTAAPSGPALSEPLQRPAGSSDAPAHQETWEVTETQFWTREPVLDRDRDPFQGWGLCSGQ